ncbi:MAG: selenoneine synthase SenA [Caldimonas sp.]|uniref:selenoneine synthase SenA n=1 Tax=Caldimonas sp. TaxID=2838790 RepID=UPI00391885DC
MAAAGGGEDRDCLDEGTSHVLDIDTPLLRQVGRDALSLALIDARNCTLRRFEAFERAGMLQVPCLPELDPPLWELGHVAWFQEYWVGRNIERYRGAQADPTRPKLASKLPQADAWYDSSQVSHDERWSLALPDALDTRAYLVDTLEATLDLLSGAPETDEGLYFFRLALFHEDMHAEALATMAQTLGLLMPDLPPPEIFAPRDPITVPHCRWTLGSARGEGFVFDNEKWAHEVRLPEFEIDAQPVSWAQFLEFIDDGGYEDRRWWSDEGWAWVQREARTAPRHVEQVRHGVLARQFGALTQVPLAAPATHVSCHEAEAWCRWAGRRLPFEAEWEAAAWLGRRQGFRHGQVWEWTASRFEPFDGFEPDPYRDYSLPWFGTHRVLKGGSRATRGRLKDPKFRNFSMPHRDDIFCGFRSCAL